ncbi:2-dehydropantoate 2-reductase [Tropicimonas sp. TH_r6]|uniref:ketopantoate reductase family protein n=1 Tax=Tropicimonas sp. TH_r6 TaxID=3082085 RepID=UPI002953C4E2|nr:2-dehydropantoate 2-reductase [Tropicimonas sp. TH_r6]MDV7144995.1 2-dehydropantoate 2-reductase [Tropicimonas sp. TH_r6]
MRFMIMGAGALGSYFGARLQAAGHDVAFIARGAHLEAMQRGGLRVRSPLGDLDLPQVRAFDRPEAAGDVDAVLFMVKTYDVETAGRSLLPCLTPETIVVTAQNGVTAHQRLAKILAPGQVAPGMVYMPADVVEPGVIRHSSDFNRLVTGPLMDGRRAPLEAMAAALESAGLEMPLVADAGPSLWEKFALLASVANVTCLTRLNLGPIRDTHETNVLLRAALDETMAVGRAVCPGLELAAGERAWDLIQSMRREVHASMLDDLRRGKRLELDDICGEIVRLGAAHGVPTPVHGFANAVLRPYLNGTPD